jgi:hypothetical protein
MVRAESAGPPYLTSFTNGVHRGSADNAADKGGQGNGFRPHELLEAALASCMNMWLRMYRNQPTEPNVTLKSILLPSGVNDTGPSSASRRNWRPSATRWCERLL